MLMTETIILPKQNRLVENINVTRGIFQSLFFQCEHFESLKSYLQIEMSQNKLH